MKRRTALKQLAAGATASVALVGSSTAVENDLEAEFAAADTIYHMTEDGPVEVDSDGSVAPEDCSVSQCCECPGDCDPVCACLEPC